MFSITDSPLVKAIITEAHQDSILEVLEARFATVPEELARLLRSVVRERHLQALLRCAVLCPSLKAFRARLLLIRPLRRRRA
ncbi:MAG: hypothetical protein L0Z62_21010 [Gemmataceae bacterium]|nr:hypothetical protein [Gemmataceae bacterium]